ncbi:hypothetical protein L3073_15760 [Ancylomarina sp. DW003]|nr:hypothetical protein [Ancylomarina sp. DW003]MDE5423675.1 hypothetical protein [Ancylomarina sp. DW003]
MRDKIDSLQIFVNHTVLEVLCKADKAKPFSIDLFHPQFKQMVIDISDDHIFTPIQNSYEICKGLPKSQLRVLEKAVRVNNQIEKLCNGELEPVTFDDLKAINEDLRDNLYKFNKCLFENVLGLKPFYSKYRHIDEHYRLFSKHNRFNRCPACGLKRMLKPEEVDFDNKAKREAYDHYFNKARYPFSVVNFLNLVPLCDDCNSKYKTQRDIINDKEGRVKAFFPFSDIPHKEISVKVDVINEEFKNAKVELVCNGKQKEVDTWDRVFSVASRYESYFEGEDCNAAISEAYDYCQLSGKEKYVKLLSNNLFANENFLKIPLIEEIIEDDS